MRKILIIIGTLSLAILLVLGACAPASAPEKLSYKGVVVTNSDLEVWDISLINPEPRNRGFYIRPGVLSQPSLIITFKPTKYTVPKHPYLVEARETPDGPVIASTTVSWDKITTTFPKQDAQFFLTSGHPIWKVLNDWEKLPLVERSTIKVSDYIVITVRR